MNEIEETPPMRYCATALFLLWSFCSYAATPEDEVRQAETSFAKAFADRDPQRFAAFIAPDATFIVGGKGVSSAAAIVKAWSGLLSPPAPPFSWKSEQAFVDASGKQAMSIGGIFDPKGNRIGTFTSFWRRDGAEWHVVFDGPAAMACPEKQ